MHTSSIRNTLKHAFLLTAASAILATAWLPAWSAEPGMPRNMKIVVPFAPGASTDLLGRAVAAAIAAKFGNTVIVENRPGAGSVVGTSAIAKATPDGSNLLLATNAFAITAALQPGLPYDSVADFAPLAVVMTGPFILAVSSTTPYKSAAELIAAARANPGAMNYGSPGIGSSAHMNGELLNTSAGTQIVHVAYKGVAPALTDLMAGRIQFIITSNSSLSGLLQAGKVRPLAVTSIGPNAAWPDLPPLSATLPGYRFDGWFGIITTGGTPPATVDFLNREIRAVCSSEQFLKFIQQERSQPSQMSATAFAAMVKDEIAQWKRIAAERNIKPE